MRASTPNSGSGEAQTEDTKGAIKRATTNLTSKWAKDVNKLLPRALVGDQHTRDSTRETHTHHRRDRESSPAQLRGAAWTCRKAAHPPAMGV